MIREHPTAMRCKACGYDLRSLPEHRCPECGRRFDPDNPRTFLTKPVCGRRYLSLAVVGAVLVATPLIIAELADLDVLHLPPLLGLVLLLPLWMPTGFVVGWFVLRTSGRVMVDRLPWTEHHQAFVMAFLLSCFILIGGFGAVIFQLIARFLG